MSTDITVFNIESVTTDTAHDKMSTGMATRAHYNNINLTITVLLNILKILLMFVFQSK